MTSHTMPHLPHEPARSDHALTTPDRLAYLTAGDDQLHRRLADSRVLTSTDEY